MEEELEGQREMLHLVKQKHLKISLNLDIKFSQACHLYSNTQTVIYLWDQTDGLTSSRLPLKPAKHCGCTDMLTVAVTQKKPCLIYLVHIP